MAIMTGKKEALAQVSKNWIQGLSKLGFVSPEVLITWKSDAIQFRQQIVREMTGEDAEVIMKRLESKDQLTPSPYPNGYAFSLATWREWVQAFMEQLLEVIITRQSRENTSMNNIIKYIEQHYHDELSLQEVATKFFVSREYVSRRFKQEYGINFTDYIGKYRIEKAKLLMQNQYLKLSQIAEMVGFHDVKYFSKVFKKQEGLSPKEYRLTLPEA
jgi:two-component system response regulator YesN